MSKTKKQIEQTTLGDKLALLKQLQNEVKAEQEEIEQDTFVAVDKTQGGDKLSIVLAKRRQGIYFTMKGFNEILKHKDLIKKYAKEQGIK